MAFIANLSEQLQLITPQVRDRHLNILSGLGLPISFSAAEWPELYAAMKLDKKSRGNTVRFVVITDIGKTQRLENPIESELIKAYERLAQ